VEKIRAGPPPVLRPPRRLAEDPGPGPPTSLGSTRTPAPLGGSLSRPATQPSSSLALSLSRPRLATPGSFAIDRIVKERRDRRRLLYARPAPRVHSASPLFSGRPRRLSASRPALVSRLSVVSLDRGDLKGSPPAVQDPTGKIARRWR